MEIGTILREAREEKGITLDRLQEITKIQKRYLIAIEEENFYLLPGRFYAKAFIREYATAVGIESDDLITRYEKIEKPDDEDELSEYTNVKQSPVDITTNTVTSALLPKVMVVLLIIGILFAAVYFYKKNADSNSTDTLNEEQGSLIYRDEDGDDSEQSSLTDTEDEDKEENSTEEKTDDKEDEDKEDEEENTDVSFETVEVGEGVKPESIVSVTGVQYPLQLKLTMAGDTWVTLKDDRSQALINETLGKDDSPKTLEIDDAKELDLVIGDATKLDIEINGQAFEYPVDPANKVYQQITFTLEE